MAAGHHRKKVSPLPLRTPGVVPALRGLPLTQARVLPHYTRGWHNQASDRPQAGTAPTRGGVLTDAPNFYFHYYYY